MQIITVLWKRNFASSANKMLMILRLIILFMEIYYKDIIKMFLNSLYRTIRSSTVYSSKNVQLIFLKEITIYLFYRRL